MPIKINFDASNMPEKPTLVLAKRSGEKLGTIRTQALKIKDSCTDIPELYFEVHKYIDSEKEPLWESIDDLKLIWCKEADIWFDVQVNINESNEIVKTVNCKGLGHSELSQIYLYETEINTEADIERDDYVVTVLYDSTNPKASLLNRILSDKAPHYTIQHVDASIQEIQRSFSFNGTTICDAFNEIAKEIECIFDIHVSSDENGNIKRTINVYDLLNYCTSCKHREANMTVCPECGSTNILSGFGEDTTIFVTADELADDISFDSDVDSVKNCFRLSGGDDLMTSTIRNCNPNGSSYIWYIPEYMRNEMSQQLQDKLNAYDELYNKYQTNTTDTTLIGKINNQKDIVSACAIYSEQAICRLGHREYVAHCNSNTGFAIGGWISIDNDNGFWNFPFICTTNANAWTYYYIDNPDSDTPYQGESIAVGTSIVVNGQQWYYNINANAMAGNFGNHYDRGFYFGIFNSAAEAAEFLITNYLNGNSYNLLAKRYNSLLEKYETDNNISAEYKHEEIQEIPYQIYNYPQLMEAYYNSIDMKLFLESSLSPPVNLEVVNNDIDRQIEIIDSLSYTGGSNVNFAIQTTNLNNVSDETLLIAAKNYIKNYISSNYKIELSNLERSNDAFNTSLMTIIVNVTIKPYSSLSDETSKQTVVMFSINNDYETYLKTRIDAIISNIDEENVTDISSLFGQDIDNFRYMLMFFNSSQLQSFADACQSCLDILISQGINDGNNPDIYESLYLPYYDKSVALNNELTKREQEIKSIAEYESNGELVAGIQYNIIEERDKIRILLNFQNYIGEDLWSEFCSYRREDEYSNDNYISDGLNNTELLEKALQFIETANKEIHKAAIVQHTISTTLKNLLMIEKFKPLVDCFEVGNWIRVQIDETVYKLRLVSYEMDYDNPQNLSVEFSDVMTSIDGYTDIQDIISRAESMATSYDYVSRQAKRGEESKDILNNWVEVGLDATNVKFIGGADNQTQTWDEHGMLFRTYNVLEDTYDDRQLKIINSTIAITDDNWKHIRTAIGRFLYNDPSTNALVEAYGVNGETIVGKLILGEQLAIYNSENTLKFDKNGLFIESNADGNNINVSINPNNSSIFSIKNGDDNILYVDENGNGVLRGTIYATGGEIGGWKITNENIYDDSQTASSAGVGINKYGTGMAFYAGSTNDITGNNAKFKVDHAGNLYSSNATISGTIYATGGTIGGWLITDASIFNVSNDGTNYYTGMNNYGSGAAFYAGSVNNSQGSETQGFAVYHDGRMYAQNAYIRGVINATSGSLGHWAIDSIGLASKSYIWLNNGVDGTQTESGALIYRYGLQSLNGGNASGTYQNLRYPLFYVMQQKFTGTEWVDDKFTFYIAANGELYVQGVTYLNQIQIASMPDYSHGNGEIRDTMLCGGALIIQAWNHLNNDPNTWYNVYIDCNNFYVNGTALNGGSKELYKQNITTDISKELDPHKLYNMPIYQFDFKDEYKEFDIVKCTQVGFIAEIVNEYYPSACIKDRDGNVSNWEVRAIVPAMLKLLQEQKDQIEQLQNEISDLKAMAN